MQELESLSLTVDRFCQFIVGLPPEELCEQTWGPCEVLGHLVYHHEKYVEQLEALVAGKAFQLPKGRFADLNAEAARQARGIAPGILLDRFKIANARLCVLYAEPALNGIAITIKAGSKPWKLKDLIPSVEAHIRNHQKELEKRRKAKK